VRKKPSAKVNKHFVMDRWLDILEGEPPRMVEPPVLHHYTDAFGVHGIITSNTLWATATQFSNDRSEIDYAAAVAIEVIEELWGRKKNLSLWEGFLAEHLVKIFATPLHAFGQPFIVSFCEDGDLLSQWRAYGRTSGFSLAFPPLFERDTMRLVCKNGFRTMIKKVVYDPKSQRARLQFLFKHLIQLVSEFTFSPTSAQGASAHMELSLLLLLEMTDWASVVKHQSFSEEKEWRIITYPKGATLHGVKQPTYKGVSIRPTSKLLLPYMILEPSSGSKLPIVEVRCGPSEFQEQSSRALRILLRNAGYKDAEVAFSGAPLRV